jgi:tripartite-type tricarboxylate transporter receptor subunit TctC
LFKRQAGIDILHVPYRGNAPMTVAVVGGEVNMVFDSLTGPLAHIRAGALRALAVMGTKRNEVLPDVPTFSEAALPGFSYESWNGILAPAGTPDEAVNRMQGEIAKALALPDVRERLIGLGYEPAGNTPRAFAALIAADLARFGKVIEEAGIKAD